MLLITLRPRSMGGCGKRPVRPGAAGGKAWGEAGAAGVLPRRHMARADMGQDPLAQGLLDVTP